jgi:paired amphipathic helix protein Sin3a
MIRSLLEPSASVASQEFTIESGLTIKIALGNYRIFYTPETEEYIHRRRSGAEIEVMEARETKAAEGAKKRLDDFVDRHLS